MGQVLCGENTTQRVAARFYKAVVQAILLYGSETWNISKTALAQLEGFHIRAAYRMACIHRPKKGAFGVWTYPRMAGVLEECGMHSIAEYINKRRQTIAVYVTTRPMLEECRQGERQRQGGSMRRQWWWEQPMEFDQIDPPGDLDDPPAATPRELRMGQREV